MTVRQALWPDKTALKQTGIFTEKQSFALRYGLEELVEMLVLGTIRRAQHLQGNKKKM